jgi:hypothetical protein
LLINFRVGYLSLARNFLTKRLIIGTFVMALRAIALESFP